MSVPACSRNSAGGRRPSGEVCRVRKRPQEKNARWLGMGYFARVVAVAQLVRAPGCGSGGRGFKPHQPPLSVSVPLHGTARGPCSCFRAPFQFFNFFQLGGKGLVRESGLLSRRGMPAWGFIMRLYRVFAQNFFHIPGKSARIERPSCVPLGFG